MASKFAEAYGKRGLLLAIAVLTALIAAKAGGHQFATGGFFDGG